MNQNHENIDPQVFSLLENLRFVPDRDTRRASQTREIFLGRARSIKLNVKKDGLTRMKEKIFSSTNLGAQPRRMVYKPLLISLIVILMLFGSVSGVAFAAQDSLPGQTLYPVKLLSEDVRLNLTGNPQDKMLLETSFVQRRFAEMATIDQEGVDVPQQVLERLNLQLENVFEGTIDVDNPALVQVLSQVETALNAGDGIVERGSKLTTRQIQGATFQQYMEAQHRLVSEGLQNPDGFRNRLRNGAPDGQSSEPDDQPGDGTEEGDRLQEQDRQRDQLRLRLTSAAAESTPAGESTPQAEATSLPEMTPQAQNTSLAQQTPQQVQQQEQHREQEQKQKGSGKSDGGSGGSSGDKGEGGTGSGNGGKR